MNIGQRVRIIADCKWRNQVGTIHAEAAGQFHVAGPDFGPYWFRESELVAVREDGDSFADRMAQRSLAAVQHETWKAKQ